MSEDRGIRVTISRGKGLESDLQMTARFTPEELEIVRYVLAMVNGCTRNQEYWCLEIEGQEGRDAPNFQEGGQSVK